MRAKITKIRNDRSQYVTRKSLALSAFAKSVSKRDLAHERRDAAGVLDDRWYMRVSSKTASG